MVTVKDGGAYYLGDGTFVQDDQEAGAKLALRGIKVTREEARNRTMAWQILSAHNKGTDPEKLARINNIIMELEKSVINLGSAISESDESENVQLTEEQIAELKNAA